MPISERTESIISAHAASYGHGQLTGLLKYAGLGKGDPGKDKPGGSWNNLETRVSAALGKNPTADSLIALATKILNDRASNGSDVDWVLELRSCLLEDGYDASFNGGRWAISPVGAKEVPLPPQVSDLEAALTTNGLPIAANHYRQAFSAFKRQDWEACNSATRSTVEGFLVESAKTKAGFTPGPGQGGGNAIQSLANAGLFHPGEHDYVKGFWKMSHTNGSHPGLSSEQEALFRFSAATSALTFFLHRWGS